jgi:DNA-directed RNA polymerase I subunit RPA2
MSSTTTQTKTSWSVEYDTLRRDKLFNNPPKDQSAFPLLQAAIKPHVESFNAIFGETNLIGKSLEDIGIHTVTDGDPRDTSRATARNKLQLRVTDVSLQPPQLPDTNKYATRREIYPSECRERHTSYRGTMKAMLEYRINNGEWLRSTRTFGQVPIMVRSNRCHLERFTPDQMVAHKEDSEELGGYFIVNGNEKVVRLLIMPKRNYPMAISRPGFLARGPTFSKYGVTIRSVRPDQTSQTTVLHYLTDGNVTLRFSWRKNEYYMPVIMILKALAETNDREIAAGIIGTASKGQKPSSFVAERTELLLRTFKAYNLKTRSQTLAYIGEKFRPVLGIPITMADEKAGEEFLRRVILPHLGNVHVTEAQNNDKYQLMLFMIRKLYSVAAGDCTIENPDAVANQEVLLSGFLYGMILKEAIAEWLVLIGIAAQEWCRSKNINFSDRGFGADFNSKISRKVSDNLGGKLEYFLSTGNLVSPTGLDQSQTSGFAIVAEKINFYRFISHFRCIHRGAFFAELKTTAVRKLLPESWGFLCPVHTPDGAPCGLLNHLAHQCVIPTQTVDTSKIEKTLSSLGLESVPSMSVEDSLAVQLDGRLLGYCSAPRTREIAQLLRHWKVNGENSIPVEMEIGHVPTSNGGLYPGLYLFTQPSRMIRPVKYFANDKLDYVGPFEQQYMNIACIGDDTIPNLTTHIEYTPTNILSILANMTPFSDFNQSPRNMYQCQMSKQTMGTPSTNLMYRTDNKAYLLQTGQTPIVRPPLYNAYGLDNYPNGTNAVVAVISYTGYDMDDAMIINKSAHERGFGDGVIYKTKVYPLKEESRSRSRTDVKSLFGFANEAAWEDCTDPCIPPEARSNLQSDGLPYTGLKVSEGSTIAAHHTVMYNPSTNGYENFDGRTTYIRYKDSEDAYVDQIRMLGDASGDQPCQAISIKFRIPRRPVIGDKFSSRHGQKGVCSFLWPSEDMPFSESGIQPDVIINPHAFPSRMTIGMFVESLAGKSGALHGLAQDCTPFSFSEDHPAGDFFGEQLRAAGYNFYGNEPMYSGITGQEFAADIYMGVVYYQRLRHMVSDKFQVRTTGPVNALTGQPIKGRSKGGGVRVGEMERDSLIAHGCAFLLQDRLMDCSDKTRAWVCRKCGSFLATMMVPNQFGLNRSRRGAEPSGMVRCRGCAREAKWSDSKMDTWEDGHGRKFVGGDDTTVLSVPGVLRYLDVELGAMGVKMGVRVQN